MVRSDYQLIMMVQDGTSLMMIANGSIWLILAVGSAFTSETMFRKQWNYDSETMLWQLSFRDYFSEVGLGGN